MMTTARQWVVEIPAGGTLFALEGVAGNLGEIFSNLAEVGS
jgi:hypothetical protein